ncbi:hypothetical protein ATANTOWER_028058 [Ataeniobius toweri]|uniref:Uncharacterized protein n=1 Tax=Ataeniobius toweri TaxID=208326 RepID=A0ABU7AIF1_9TELE|nr:hypothetical protein [Ataeniobius toweri]
MFKVLPFLCSFLRNPQVLVSRSRDLQLWLKVLSFGSCLSLTDSSIPTPPDKRTLLTLHQLFTKDSPAASVQSSQAPYHSSTPTSIQNMLCLQSWFQSNLHYLSNKLVKLFSCLLSVILLVGQIFEENYDRTLRPI